MTNNPLITKRPEHKWVLTKNLNFMLDAGCWMLILLEGVAAFEVEPDFGLDITAVDTTLGDEDVPPFYRKEMRF